MKISPCTPFHQLDEGSYKGRFFFVFRKAETAFRQYPDTG